MHLHTCASLVCIRMDVHTHIYAYVHCIFVIVASTCMHTCIRTYVRTQCMCDSCTYIHTYIQTEREKNLNAKCCREDVHTHIHAYVHSAFVIAASAYIHVYTVCVWERERYLNAKCCWEDTPSGKNDEFNFEGQVQHLCVCAYVSMRVCMNICMYVRTFYMWASGWMWEARAEVWTVPVCVILWFVFNYAHVHTEHTIQNMHTCTYPCIQTWRSQVHV